MIEIPKAALGIRAKIDIIRRRRRIIIAGIACSLAIGLLVMWLSKPVYESSATLYVAGGQDYLKTSNDSYEGVLMRERLAKTYSRIITGRFIQDEVAKNLGLGGIDSIAADPVRDTNLIQVTARSSDPGKAKAILTLTIEVFSKKLFEIEPAPSENQAASSQGSGFKSRASRSPAVRVSVIDPPFTPDAPVSPKPKLNMALALLLGTAGSIGIVLIMEYLDVSIKGPDNLERALGLPVLGSIPVSKSSKQDVRGIEVFSNPTSAVSEAFLALRTNLQYLNFDRALKTIAITSAGSGEGKTIIACNLASALAKAGSQVVLMSCDLRRPSVHEVFHINGERGLSNVLAGQLSFMDVLVPIRKGLNVIASGPVPPNPPELLGSGRMKELVEQAKRISDFVILDCPPVLPVTDAAVLSALADGFLIVAKAGSTSGISAVKAKGVLEKVSARILGAVLNFADAVSNRDYSEYGYGYYSYSKPAKEHPSGAEVTLDR